MKKLLPTARDLAVSLIPVSQEAKKANILINSVTVPYCGVRKGKEFASSPEDEDSVVKKKKLMGIEIKYTTLSSSEKE